MNKYPKSILVTVLIIVCTAFVMECLHRSPLFTEPGLAGAQSVGPARLMRVSAYCPCKICCGKWADGYTASGKPAVGLIVAAPPNINFGTVLKIPGYGVAIVQDRGGAITGNRLDVLFPTHEQAKQWGVQYLMVKEIR